MCLKYRFRNFFCLSATSYHIWDRWNVVPKIFLLLLFWIDYCITSWFLLWRKKKTLLFSTNNGTVWYITLIWVTVRHHSYTFKFPKNFNHSGRSLVFVCWIIRFMEKRSWAAAIQPNIWIRIRNEKKKFRTKKRKLNMIENLYDFDLCVLLRSSGKKKRR